MTLLEWCAASKGRRLQLATSSLICAEQIDKIKRGEIATLRVALKIQKHTDGQVTAASLVSAKDRELLDYYRG